MPNWKKVIVSGSDALLNTLVVSNGAQITGSLLVTGSTTQTGNNTLIGNTNLSGSINVTGSQTFIGNLSLTGSFLVTGSTIQVGNNTLLGNTVLSGSIVISGSVAPGNLSASVNIFGDTAMTGFLRFNPYPTNIDTSISASYIYVSGSTNDLYFAQNGNGYNNVTRLRWLEGNLYTGLLNGGLITTQSPTVYQVGSGSGIVVSLNASLNDNPYPTITYVNWGNLSASIAPLSASYDQTFVAIGNSGSIAIQGTPYYDGQFDTLIPIGLVLHQNRSTINGVKTQPSVAYGWKQRSNVFITAFGPLKLSGFTLAASGSSTGSLVVGSGTGFADGANYTIDPSNPSYVTDTGTSVSKIYRYYQSGSGWVYDTNGGTGYGAIDPTKYSNNGVLTAVPGTGINREWTNQRVYWFANSVAKAIVVYYGNQTYATELEAIANVSIESFVEAPNTAANAIYLGFITVRNNADFTDTDSYKISPGGLFRSVGGSGGGGSVVTQTLAGLSDVNISGPTNGQPLVYNSTSLKWENQSTLTATLIGNATTATTASYASTASYVITAQTASYYGGAVTSASFASTASYAAESLLTTNVKGAANRILFNNGTNTTTTSNELTWTDSTNLLTLGTATGTAGTINKLALYTSSFGGYGFGVSPGQLDYVTDGSHVFYKNGVTPTELLRITNTGNVSIAGTLTVTGSIAGSLVGTASYATQALSASYYGGSVISSSFASTASYVLNAVSASFAPSTPTFPYTGSAIISGSLIVTGSLDAIGSANISGSLAIRSGSFSLTGSGDSRVYIGKSNQYPTLTAVQFEVGAPTNTNWNILGGTSTMALNSPGGRLDIMVSNNLNVYFYDTYAKFRYSAIFGTTTPTPSAIVHVRGAGTTSATTAFLVENSTPTNLFKITDNGVTTITGTTQITGSAQITGSLIISSSNTTQLTLLGSGSALPIFTVQGSQGELFSVTDSLSGSLFSVNDISGLPILEVFSDGTTLIGDYQAPSLYTTRKISASLGVNTIYSLNTGSYDGVFMDYVVRSGSNSRAGTFTALWGNGSTTNYMDNSTTDFGNTSGFIFGALISGSNMVVTGSASTIGWTIKSIIRSI